jgi:hypothetical protein
MYRRVNNLENTTLSIIDILRAISDDKSLVLFNTIALTTSSETGVLISGLGLTKKQYYSRMSGLVDVGLIMREKGDYFLTSFGKVVYAAQMLIGKAKENYWKLKAIDSIESSNNELTYEERIKIIDSLILDDDLKSRLIGLDRNKGDDQRLIAPQQHLDQKLRTQQ